MYIFSGRSVRKMDRSVLGASKVVRAVHPIWRCIHVRIDQFHAEIVHQQFRLNCTKPLRVGQVCDIAQLPSLRKYESRKIVWSSLGFCCSILYGSRSKLCADDGIALRMCGDCFGC
jgi:hypothetical protein